jgi:hypothetical protein
MLRGNEKRAVQVFKILIEAFEKKELSWFNPDLLPQKKFLPKELKEDKVAENSQFWWKNALALKDYEWEPLYFRF